MTIELKSDDFPDILQVLLEEEKKQMHLIDGPLRTVLTGQDNNDKTPVMLADLLERPVSSANTSWARFQVLCDLDVLFFLK